MAGILGRRGAEGPPSVEGGCACGCCLRGRSSNTARGASATLSAALRPCACDPVRPFDRRLCTAAAQRLPVVRGRALDWRRRPRADPHETLENLVTEGLRMAAFRRAIRAALWLDPATKSRVPWSASRRSTSSLRRQGVLRRSNRPADERAPGDYSQDASGSRCRASSMASCNTRPTTTRSG